ncbi:MAG: peptidyl-prolyl cis-trans isomerase, partial [Pseudomonadota bacterium]
DFRAPEYREIKILSLTPETVARPDDISEEDARYEYEQRAERYYQPERRKVRQMSFPSSEAAREAAAELEGGKTFEDLMNERGLSNNDVALGTMAKDDFLDETLGDTAFSLEEGETSGAVEGRFSTVILNVEELLPESTRPYEEVKDEIIRDLAAEQAEREILDLLDEVEDARAGGALLDEIGERFSLPVETPTAFDQTGKSISGGNVELPEAEGLLAAVFESDVGLENDVLTFGDQGFLWYEVDNVIPERDQSLDEVRDVVIAAWKADQSRSRLSEKAEQIQARLEGGTPLETLAGEAELEVKRAENLARNAPSGDFGPEAMTAVFGGPVGTSAVAASADGQQIVFKVAEVAVPDFDAASSANAALNQQLSQQISDSLLGQFITDRQNEAGVEVNEVGISQAIGLNPQ